MKRRYIYGLLLIAVVAVLFLVVRSSVTEDRLVGAWVLSDIDNSIVHSSNSPLPLPLILRADGTYQGTHHDFQYGIVSDEGTWAVMIGNRLRLTSTKYGEETYIIRRVTAEELALSPSGSGGITYIYSKYSK